MLILFLLILAGGNDPTQTIQFYLMNTSLKTTYKFIFFFGLLYFISKIISHKYKKRARFGSD